MIRQIEFCLPAQCPATVSGFIYEADDPADLGQDMMEVRLDNGITIDAGWYPEGDPSGQYRVTVQRGADFLIPARKYQEAYAAIDAIIDYIKTYSDGAVAARADSRDAEA